jgi:predicted dehydrogenase
MQVGVIGLGRLWRKRYRPALRALEDRFRVRAVADVLHQRAMREASLLGCAAAAGPTDLVQRHDIDAMLLLDAAWQRLWPVGVACRFGKPVFCCPSLEWDEEHADGLLERVGHSGVPVVMEMAPRAARATARLRELLDGGLGPTRLVLCCACGGAEPGGLWAGRVALLDWCAALLPGEPLSVERQRTEHLTALLLRYAGGAVAHLLCRHAGPPGRRLRLEAVGERGSVVVHWPRRVRWSDQAGRHQEVLPAQPSLGQALLEQFHRAVSGADVSVPTLADAHRLLGWLRG